MSLKEMGFKLFIEIIYTAKFSLVEVQVYLGTCFSIVSMGISRIPKSKISNCKLKSP